MTCDDIRLLPATLHVPVAELCIEHKTHFVSASYVSKEMRPLHLKAKEAGVILLQELGLDPGIDRIFSPSHFKLELSADKSLKWRQICRPCH